MSSVNYNYCPATAIASVIGNPKEFKNGREFSAWIGLVPRQASSGGKNILLGISKRGDRYLRTLLIHGARAVVCRASNKEDRRSQWINQIRNRWGRCSRYNFCGKSYVT